MTPGLSPLPKAAPVNVRWPSGDDAVNRADPGSAQVLFSFEPLHPTHDPGHRGLSALATTLRARSWRLLAPSGRASACLAAAAAAVVLGAGSLLVAHPL